MTDITITGMKIRREFGGFDRLVERLRLWRRRAQGRAQLARFDDRQLRDIGLSRAGQAWEVGKPFWLD
ncbi:MAG: DUF1127 domain-containing protein [Alphaproteobacteria bacterium]|jgi:uncharacterized protein YjiS (DUF1127 family)|nr:DUF1127 domain-containing protein [Alphaproteobacteria bacterium]MDP6566091.1 DUF1127 domain-containing protein [Alphaproteobacteria bacterium]MDP6812917.1 DUF1127 domain-containing protein [Alphaproteobacteria bacterium]